MAYTVAAVKKLETALEDAGYTIRYAKGSFSSGYCILNSERLILINKFSTTDGRFYALSSLVQLLSKELQANNRKA